MEILHTRCGDIAASGVVERFADGGVMSCTPARETRLDTRCGALVPQFTTDDLRRRTVQAVSFFPNGNVRALPLERPTEVATPAGPVTAELVTFHPEGTLCRVFPLNGKLSGMWTEADEAALATPLRVDTPLGVVEKKIIGLRFDPAGRLLSLTLWPGETLDVPTPQGIIAARTGVAFRPDGGLRSLEPARPQPVKTPAGSVMAYDLDAIGVCGDTNSLEFSENGEVARVRTNLSRLVAQGPDGGRRVFEPFLRESICGDGDREISPLSIEFATDATRVRTRQNAPWTELAAGEWRLRTEPFLAQFATAVQRLSCAG